MMILVTGAAGKTGRSIIRALKERRQTVRALLHRAEQAPGLQALGVEEVQVGDLRDQNCLTLAMQGVSAVYHIAPNVHPEEVEIGKAVIRAARSSEIEHFVFHSVLHPQVEAMPHHWLKLKVEEALFESGLPFTILQPAVYMQNMLTQWDQIVGQGVYSAPYAAESRLSLVDLEDVGKSAAIVLTEPGHQGATYELVGTPAMTQLEITLVLSEKLGRAVAFKKIELEDWERTARAAGLGDHQVSALLKMFTYYEQFGLIGNRNSLHCLLGNQPNSFEDFIQRTINERNEPV